jgi:hypothetical protein
MLLLVSKGRLGADSPGLADTTDRKVSRIAEEETSGQRKSRDQRSTHKTSKTKSAPTTMISSATTNIMSNRWNYPPASCRWTSRTTAEVPIARGEYETPYKFTGTINSVTIELKK